MTHFLKNPQFISLLQKTPHIIKDDQGIIYSQSLRVPKELLEAFSLTLGGHLLIIQAQKHDHLFLTALLNLEYKNQWQDNNLKYHLKREETLLKDIKWPLHNHCSAHNFADRLLNQIKILRSYFLNAEGEIYRSTTGDQFTLLASFNQHDQCMAPKDSPQITLSAGTLEGCVAIAQIPFIGSFPLSFPSVFIADNNHPWKKYACFPLSFGHQSKGILLIKSVFSNFYQDKETGEEYEQKILTNFASSLSHLLEIVETKNLCQEEDRQLDNLKHYISHQLIKTIQTHGQQNRHRPMRKKIIALHCDIRSFTTISEKLKPQELVRLLNIYFTHITSPIQDNHGMLIKIVGDAIIAVWNGAFGFPHSEIYAMKAAISMQKKMILKVAPLWQSAGIERVGIGLGISSGDCLIGNVGSSDYLNFTAMGDAMDNSHHLETLARPGQIIVSEEIHQKISFQVAGHKKVIRDIALKGLGEHNNCYVYQPFPYPDY